MKRIPKTGIAHLQQTKSLNSRAITLLHTLVSDQYCKAISMDTASANMKEHFRNMRDLTRVITKLAGEQREVKYEIRAARTSVRVYKKHPPVRAQARGGIIVDRAAA
jgi:hypothetical protein